MKRVKEVAEEAGFYGSYLNPIAFRFDFSDSRTGVEKCFTFICFPFFQIGKTLKMRQKRLLEHDPAAHPTRLLQLNYRMNDTTKGEETQSIRLLSGQKLKWFVQAPALDTAHLPMKAHQYSIFVPQMWAVVSDSSKSALSQENFDVVLMTLIRSCNHHGVNI